MFYIVCFFVSWSLFIILGDKRRFRTIYQTVMLAMIMSLSSDIFVKYYTLWTYHDGPRPIMLDITDDFAVYPMIAYFYVQYLPKRWWSWFLYTLCWTLAGITVEFFMLRYGYIQHHKWWTLFSSYITDWIIFVILTAHHLWVKKGNLDKHV